MRMITVKVRMGGDEGDENSGSHDGDSGDYGGTYGGDGANTVGDDYGVSACGYSHGWL